jgi:hypothetical protein
MEFRMKLEPTPALTLRPIGDCHASEESPENRAETRRLQEEAEEAPPSRRRAAELGQASAGLYDGDDLLISLLLMISRSSSGRKRGKWCALEDSNLWPSDS